MKKKIKVEHCDVKECPECNKKAYKKGWKDATKFIVEKMSIKFKGKIN